MFDSTKIDVKSLKFDLVKNAVVVIVARILKFYVVDNAGGKGDVSKVFDQDFVYSLVFLLLGFTVFWVVVNPVVNN